MPTPPAEIPRWATDSGATVTTPVSTKQDSGWVGTEKPPAGIFNWLGKWTYEWIAYARDAVSYLDTTLSALVTTVAGKLAADGSNNITGSLQFDSADAHDIGTHSVPARNVYVGTLLETSTLVVDNNGQVNGSLTVGGTIALADTSTATAPVHNTLTSRLSPKAIASISTDGAGGISLLDGGNIASVALSGTGGAKRILVTLATAMASTSYQVMPSYNGGVANKKANVNSASKTTTTFLITLEDTNGGGILGFDNNAAVVDLVVFGVQ